MNTFVNISAAEMRAFLRPEKGWYEVDGYHEFVYQCPISFMPAGTVLKLYTGINKHNNNSRKPGGDAIRIAVVDGNGNGKGILSSAHIKRVVNWKQNIINRITDIYAELKRFRKYNSAWGEQEKLRVCELSTLDANQMYRANQVILPNGETFSLSNARKDMNDDEVAGWRFQYRNQDYLVIND